MTYTQYWWAARYAPDTVVLWDPDGDDTRGDRLPDDMARAITPDCNGPVCVLRSDADDEIIGCEVLRPCENDCGRLAREEPMLLVRWINDHRDTQRNVVGLANMVEALGRDDTTLCGVSTIMRMTRHEAPIVREAAVDALLDVVGHIGRHLVEVAKTETDDGVRSAAHDIRHLLSPLLLK